MAVNRDLIFLAPEVLYSDEKDAISLDLEFYNCFSSAPFDKLTTAYKIDNIGDTFSTPHYYYINGSNKVAVSAGITTSIAAKYARVTDVSLGTKTLSFDGNCGVNLNLITDQITNNTLGYFGVEFYENGSKTSGETYSGYSFPTYSSGGFCQIDSSATYYFTGFVKNTTNSLSITPADIVCGLLADGSNVNIYVEGVSVFTKSYSQYISQGSNFVGMEFKIYRFGYSGWVSTEDADVFSFETIRGLVIPYGFNRIEGIEFSPVNIKFLTVFKYDNNVSTSNLDIKLSYFAVPEYTIQDRWRNYRRSAERL